MFTVGGSAELSATVEGTIQRVNILYYRRASSTHAYPGPRTCCRIIPDTSLRTMCYPFAGNQVRAWFSCLLHYHSDFFSTCKGNNLLYSPSKAHPKWGMHSWHLLAEGKGGVLGKQPGRQWEQGRLCGQSRPSDFL